MTFWWTVHHWLMFMELIAVEYGQQAISGFFGVTTHLFFTNIGCGFIKVTV